MRRGVPRRPGPARRRWRWSSGPPGVVGSASSRGITFRPVVAGGEMPVVGGMAGEGEEDLVEGGAPDADVVDREAGVGEAGGGGGGGGGRRGGGGGGARRGRAEREDAPSGGVGGGDSAV